MAAQQRDGWKSSGLVKGRGIPSPSGEHRVGCVDLMHQLEGDDRGLLIRIHYPTQALPNSGYEYSLWYPHPKYIRGLLDYSKFSFSGVLSSLLKTFSCECVEAVRVARYTAP